MKSICLILVLAVFCHLEFDIKNWLSNLEELEALKQQLQGSPIAAHQAYCQGDKLPRVRIFWRDDGEWRDICMTRIYERHMERYWKLEFASPFHLVLIGPRALRVTAIIKR